MTPDTCRILMDIRMTPGLTSQMVVGQAEAFAAARSVTSEEKFRVSCRIVNDRRAIEIGESHPLVKQLSKGLEKKGFRWRRLGLISLQMLRSWWNTSWMQPFSYLVRARQAWRISQMSGSR